MGCVTGDLATGQEQGQSDGTRDRRHDRYTPRNPSRSVHADGILVEGRRRALQVFVELSDEQVIEDLRSQNQE